MKKLLTLICVLFVFSLSASAYRVGDVIKIGNEFGIVFSVTTDGCHGKAVSVLHTYENHNTAAGWWSGWSLPTTQELKLLYKLKQKNIIFRKSCENWGLEWRNEYYWCRTELRGEENRKAVVHMGYGSTDYMDKSEYHWARFVTTF